MSYGEVALVLFFQDLQDALSYHSQHFCYVQLIVILHHLILLQLNTKATEDLLLASFNNTFFKCRIKFHHECSQ